MGQAGSGMISARFASVMERIFGDYSQRQLAQRVEGRLSAPTFSRLRTGRVPSPPTLGILARYFQPELAREFAHEIREMFGEDCTPETAERWLRMIATGATPPTVQVHADGQVDLRGYGGLQDLPPEDRHTLDAVIRAFISERRRARGLE